MRAKERRLSGHPRQIDLHRDCVSTDAFEASKNNDV
jgi:hypothetical protein